jgi:hypothetical protein
MPIVLRVYDKKQMHYCELVIDEACKTYYPNKDLSSIITYFVGYPQIRCDIFGGICSLYGWLT